MMDLNKEARDGSTYKIFCSSLVEVDLFACICLSACLLEYLVSSSAELSACFSVKVIPLHLISSLIINQLLSQLVLCITINQLHNLHHESCLRRLDSEQRSWSHISTQQTTR